MTYRFLPHTADVLVELEAPSLDELFLETTNVACYLLAGDSPVAGTEPQPISVTAPDAAELLHRYMRELLIRFQVDTFIPARLEIEHLDATKMVAVVWGERFDARRHEAQPEVKAVTRHEFAVAETESGWRAVMVLDM